ncbi:MAG: family 20 glycosylhydrolase [Planctomycetes bacterium]|nr:family 20 glycosylhydrolase [Planctomycetota bacterium]
MRWLTIVAVVAMIGPETMFANELGARDGGSTVIPRPAEVTPLAGQFELTATTRIAVNPDGAEVRAVAEYLAETLRECVRSTGGQFAPWSPDEQPPDTIALALTDEMPDAESYVLEVAERHVRLTAGQPRGLFYGVQTLRQLLQQDAAAESGWSIPALHIQDQPRYRWRGMLLDCGRHFMSKEFVKRYIDLLAYHKMNVLHWHLTEDQGWRIEIRKYPKLAEIGAWRKATRESEQPRRGDMYGGYYTQADVREIVAYAQSRFVTIVPEIELPGHSGGALAAYPELSCTGGPFEVCTPWGVHSEVYCAGSDQVFTFLEDVLAEVIELFPSEFIHIGGDECPKVRWEECPKCQARLKAEGLENEHELQSYFIRRIEKYLNSQGRRLIGWDEILEGGLAPNATVQSWRGMSGAIAAATAGHDVVSSPTSHCYLDYAQLRAAGEPTQMGFVDLETCYSFEPTPAQLTPEQARHVLGLEGNMWTEHAPQNRIDWQVFPRLCALAEVAWSPLGGRDWNDFQRRMATHYQRLDELGVTYFVEPPQCVTADRVFAESIIVELANPLKRGRMRYTSDGTDPTEESPFYAGPLRLTKTTVLKARTFLPNGRSSNVAEWRVRCLTPRPPVEVTDVEAGLTFACYEGSWRELPDFDQLTPTWTGTAATIDLADRPRAGHFGVVFSGYIEVPRDGTYTFALTSDDGSRLRVGSDLVVDNDGLHGKRTERGQIILEAGRHPLKVEFFQAGGPSGLDVHYAGPGIVEQPIPAAVLWH